MKPTKRRGWIPLTTMALDWSVIFLAIFASISVRHPAFTLFCLILIGSRQHALFILVHDGVHGHLAKNKWLNEFLSDYICAFPVLFDTHAYRVNHLKHHRHLNTDKDPDWVRKVGNPEWTFPVSALKILTFIPYFIFVRGPLEWGQIAFLFSGLGNRERWKSQPWRLVGKVVFYGSTLGLVTYYQVWHQLLLYWVAPLFFVFPLAQRIRSIAEHFALPLTDESTSSRTILAPKWETFLFSPHNVNYHYLHHTHPHIPFYDLPKCYAETKQDGYRNCSYILPFQGSVLRDLLNGPQMIKGEAKNERF